MLAEADWVIAVLHYGLKQPREQIQKRLLNAIRNPHVDVIGHPTGRLIGKRPGADIEFRRHLQSRRRPRRDDGDQRQPRRLDLDDIHAAAAKDHGIPIVISTDSHAPMAST